MSFLIEAWLKLVSLVYFSTCWACWPGTILAVVPSTRLVLRLKLFCRFTLFSVWHWHVLTTTKQESLAVAGKDALQAIQFLLQHSPWRSSKVDVFFYLIWKGVCYFLLLINSSFGPISHRFWDMTRNWKSHAFPTTPFNPKFENVPLALHSPKFGRRESRQKVKYFWWKKFSP